MEGCEPSSSRTVITADTVRKREREQEKDQHDMPAEAKFLLLSIADLLESEDPKVKGRFGELAITFREEIAKYAMRICGLYEANEAGSSATINVDQHVILLALCCTLKDALLSIDTPVTLKAVGFIRYFVSKIANPKAKSFPIEQCDINAFYLIIRSLPVVNLGTAISLDHQLVKDYLIRNPDEGRDFSVRHVGDVKGFQGALRKTLRRLHEKGQGGRLSMASAILLLARLRTCIMDGVALQTDNTPLIPSILFKLQGIGSAFIFDRNEIRALLDVYDSTARSSGVHEKTTEVQTVPAIQTDLNLTHHFVGMVLQSNYWMEEALEMLEDVLWKDYNAQQRAWRRDCIITAVSFNDIVPQETLAVAFSLTVRLGNWKRSGGSNYSGKPLDHVRENDSHTNECEMAAVKISVASLQPIGQGASLLPRMWVGIDRMAQSLRYFAMKNNKDSERILSLEHLVVSQKESIADTNKTISSLEAECCDLKEALKNGKEESRKNQNRQDKEAEAVFNSLNLKISTRDEQLEAAASLIKELKRELRKAETQGAKEIKKEQAKAIATEEAHDKTRAELMTTKADLEAVEASRATLKTKLEKFKEKQREFVQKAEKVKKELDGRKAADSISRATQDMIDAMVAKAIRETGDAKEKEFAARMTINNQTRDEDRKLQLEEVKMKGLQLKSKDDELVQKREELMVMESLLQDRDRSLEAANEKYALLQNTVRDYFAKERELANRRDDLKGMLD